MKDITTGALEHYGKPLTGNSSLLQGKTLPCEDQAIYQQHPGGVLTSVGASSSKMDSCKVEKCPHFSF